MKTSYHTQSLYVADQSLFQLTFQNYILYACDVVDHLARMGLSSSWIGRFLIMVQCVPSADTNDNFLFVIQNFCLSAWQAYRLQQYIWFALSRLSTQDRSSQASVLCATKAQLSDSPSYSPVVTFLHKSCQNIFGANNLVSFFSPSLFPTCLWLCRKSLGCCKERYR